MRNKNISRVTKHIYSHMISELAMLQIKNGYKVFAVSNCSHDAGAFDVTKEVAIRFADMGKRTLIINGDLYGPEEIPLDGAEKKKGLSDFLMEDPPLKDILANQYRNMLFLVGRGSEVLWQKEQMLCSPKVDTLLSALYDKFDIIFCVTPALSAPVSGKQLCKLSDAVILVAAMGRTKKKQIESAKKQLDELEVPVSGIIATQAPKTAWSQYINRFDGQLMK